MESTILFLHTIWVVPAFEWLSQERYACLCLSTQLSLLPYNAAFTYALAIGAHCFIPFYDYSSRSDHSSRTSAMLLACLGIFASSEH